MRMWNIVHLQSKLLSPAAEAFRYFIIERGEAHLLAHDAPLLAKWPAQPINRRPGPFSLPPAA